MAEEQEDLGHMHIVIRSFPRETRTRNVPAVKSEISYPKMQKSTG